MGQIQVNSIKTKTTNLEALLTAIRDAGFTLEEDEKSGDNQQRFRCGRGSRHMIIGIDQQTRDPTETFVVIPYPPYSVLPWRWPADFRFFNDLDEVSGQFHYHDQTIRYLELELSEESEGKHATISDSSDDSCSNPLPSHERPEWPDESPRLGGFAPIATKRLSGA